jgi:ACS family hexuronate transporter-like MFS transporter
VQQEFSLNEQQYGQMELGFGIAFAVGSLVFGWLIDRIGVYWLYPLVLAGWSTVGFLTGLSQGYAELLSLRILLGFFESAHFPCALKAVQILMAQRDRPLANSLLQSGSALGAILAPQAVKALLGDTAEGWRQPFLIIGAGGGAWVVFWLLSLRPSDLPVSRDKNVADPASYLRLVFSARFLALLNVVICISITWQFLPRLAAEVPVQGPRLR